MRNNIMTNNDMINMDRVLTLRKLDLEVAKVGMVYVLAFVWSTGDAEGLGERMTSFRFKNLEERDKARDMVVTAMEVDEAPRVIGGDRIEIFIDDNDDIRADLDPWGTPRKIEVDESVKPKVKGASRSQAKLKKLPEIDVVSSETKDQLYGGQLFELANMLEFVADACKAAKKDKDSEFNVPSKAAAQLINGLSDSGETEELLIEARSIWAEIENSKPNRRSRNYKIAKAMLEKLPVIAEAAAE